MDALALANKIRTHRAELKRHIRSGERSAADVLERPETEVLTMRVRDVLRAMPSVGPAKVQRMTTRARVPPATRVGDLTGRQRQDLAAEVGWIGRARERDLRTGV